MTERSLGRSRFARLGGVQTPRFESLAFTYKPVIDKRRNARMNQSMQEIAPRRPTHLIGWTTRARRDEPHRFVIRKIDRTVFVDAYEAVGDKRQDDRSTLQDCRRRISRAFTAAGVPGRADFSARMFDACCDF